MIDKFEKSMWCNHYPNPQIKRTIELMDTITFTRKYNFCEWIYHIQHKDITSEEMNWIFNR